VISAKTRYNELPLGFLFYALEGLFCATLDVLLNHRSKYPHHTREFNVPGNINSSLIAQGNSSNCLCSIDNSLCKFNVNFFFWVNCYRLHTLRVLEGYSNFSVNDISIP